MKKEYLIKLQVMVSDKESIRSGYHTHQVSFSLYANNKLDAINNAIGCLCIVSSSYEEEKISKKVGYDFRVKSYELEKIISVELMKGSK